MNKEFYNHYINTFIQWLIDEKDKMAEDIQETATFIDFREKSQDLTKLDICLINEKRRQMSTIYELIDDLNELIEK